MQSRSVIQAKVDLTAIRSNYRLACSLAPRSQTMAVIKADAYGHGAVAVAEALSPMAPAFAVARIEEALELRSAGISQPILVLTGPQYREDVKVATVENLWLLVGTWQQVRWIERAAPCSPGVWLKVDTGMHRLGFSLDEFEQAHEHLRRSVSKDSQITIATHLSSADEWDSATTPLQLREIKKIVEPGQPLSIANSAGLVAWPEARADWNRPGIMLYGVSPFYRAHKIESPLRSAMTLEARVISMRQVRAGASVGYGGEWTALRDTTLATVAAGYGDGYPRTAATGTPVVVNHQRASLVGRVCMDQLTIDVTDVRDVKFGDTVELWGKQLSVNEVARQAGTTGYELVARMPKRVPRVYETGAGAAS